jgi:hypothetical protein
VFDQPNAINYYIRLHLGKHPNQRIALFHINTRDQQVRLLFGKATLCGAIAQCTPHLPLFFIT